MGRPKALLADGAGAVLERVVSVLGRGVERVVLAGSGPVPDGLAGLERLPDAPSVKGPLAGILAAMRLRPAARWLVLACDLPLVDDRAVAWVLSRVRLGMDAVMPRLARDAPVEPLFAVYEPTCLPHLEEAVTRGELAPRRAVAAARVSHPVVPAPLRMCWTNVNTPEEWSAVRRRRERSGGRRARPGRERVEGAGHAGGGAS